MTKNEIHEQMNELSYFTMYSDEKRQDVIDLIYKTMNENHHNSRTTRRFVVLVANLELLEDVEDQLEYEFRESETIKCSFKAFVEPDLNDDELIEDAMQHYLYKEDCQGTIFYFNSYADSISFD